MTDAGFDFALAIGIADATRQRDHAVVREDVAIEGIEYRRNGNKEASQGAAQHTTRNA